MKNAFKTLCGFAAAMAITFTTGCAPKAPTEVDVSTDTSTAAPSGNVTGGSETPVTETP